MIQFKVQIPELARIRLLNGSLELRPLAVPLSRVSNAPLKKFQILVMNTNFTPEQQQEIEKMITERISSLFKNEQYVFSKPIQVLDGRNIQFGTTNGTKFGNVITIKQDSLGFYDATAVVKQNLIADPSGAGTAGVDTPARDAINSILDLLIAYGLMKSS
jgi:hypothetical protein